MGVYTQIRLILIAYSMNVNLDNYKTYRTLVLVKVITHKPSNKTECCRMEGVFTIMNTDKIIFNARNLKPVSLTSYKYDMNELPSNSYQIFVDRFAEFVPFMIAGIYGTKEHKQINWTNLFLYKKLGSWDAENEALITAVHSNDKEKMNAQLGKLPNDIAETIRPNPNIVIDNTPEKIKIEQLRQEIEKINNKIDKIARAVGIPPENNKGKEKIETYTPSK